MNNVCGALLASWELLDALPTDLTMGSPEVKASLSDVASAIERFRTLLPQLTDLADALADATPARDGEEDLRGVLSEPEEPEPHARRLLLVDDDACFGRATKRLLERLGYPVEWVSTGGDAVAAYRPGRHDVVLLDLDLPDLPGEIVLERILERFAGARVVIVSGHTGAERLPRLRRDRPHLELLGKPASMRELERAIASAVPSRRRTTSMICGADDDDERNTNGGRGPAA